uniref:Uncharacterized protein n=1 Tax=Romanomermis culicivorax TaxID=13658 RepID=A0A915KH98_ROMCU
SVPLARNVKTLPFSKTLVRVFNDYRTSGVQYTGTFSVLIANGLDPRVARLCKLSFHVICYPSLEQAVHNLYDDSLSTIYFYATKRASVATL